MQSLSKDWICDARTIWGWFEASVKDHEIFTWEIVMSDCLRRRHEESEGQLSLAKMQKVLQEGPSLHLSRNLGNNGFLAY